MQKPPIGFKKKVDLPTCGQKSFTKALPFQKKSIAMATLRLTLFPSKVLRDGRHKIRIALSHKRHTSYIVTSYAVDSLSQFRDGRVVKRPDASEMNIKLRGLLDKYQHRLDEIENPELLSCHELLNLISRNIAPDIITFQQVAETLIQELLADKRKSYAILMERNLRYFSEYTRGDFRLSDMSAGIVSGYEHFLRKQKKLSETSVGMFMSRTRTIVNLAIKKGLVSYQPHPFAVYKIKSPQPRDIAISLESLNRIRLFQTDSKRLRMTRDLFMLSFYLGGMNLIDMLATDFRKDYVEFIRTKTRNTTLHENKIRLPITAQARAILERWMNRRTGRLELGYKFSYSNLYRYITRLLNKIAELSGIEEKLVFYSARKTFAQLSSELGIPDSVIDYCLGHSDKSRGVIRYYTKVRYRQAEIALSRVADYIEHPELYQDCIEMRMDVMAKKL